MGVVVGFRNPLLEGDADKTVDRCLGMLLGDDDQMWSLTLLIDEEMGCYEMWMLLGHHSDAIWGKSSQAQIFRCSLDCCKWADSP
ncbi:hypothetical protein ACLOJK_027000 [Asimina triloba]